MTNALLLLESQPVPVPSNHQPTCGPVVGQFHTKLPCRRSLLFGMVTALLLLASQQVLGYQYLPGYFWSRSRTVLQLTDHEAKGFSLWVTGMANSQAWGGGIMPKAEVSNSSPQGHQQVMFSLFLLPCTGTLNGCQWLGI